MSTPYIRIEMTDKMVPRFFPYRWRHRKRKVKVFEDGKLRLDQKNPEIHWGTSFVGPGWIELGSRGVTLGEIWVNGIQVIKVPSPLETLPDLCFWDPML